MGKHKGPRRPPAQKKPPLTHFLCLPLVTTASRPQLESSLRTFKDDVSSRSQEANEKTANVSEKPSSESETTLPSVHPKAIRPVGALHCTLGVMSLDKERLSEAVEFLHTVDIQALLKYLVREADTATAGSTEKAASSKTIAASETANHINSLQRPIMPPKLEKATGPLMISLQGLVPMHSPHKTSILYSAPTDKTGRLYPLCLGLQKLFKDQGFLVEDTRQLKLHATIVNTIYAKGKKRLHKAEAKQQTPEAPSNDTAAGETIGPPEECQPREVGSGQTNPPEIQGRVRDERPQGHGPNANAPLKINATAMLEKYKEFVWAEEVVLDRVAICQMGAKKIFDENGIVKEEEYTEVASIRLPT